ncbi:MAG: rhodanese-like domain-containing protein [Verrucomicrobia bacterium]|nr:rhodanese-like domain-containing protein [Verrucomicrobiota bacterium]
MKTISIIFALAAVSFIQSQSSGAADAAARPYKLPVCAVSLEPYGGEHGKPRVFTHEGREIKTCCEDCQKKFTANPAKFLKQIDDAEAKLKEKARATKNVEVAAFEKLISEPGAVVLDVRTPREFAAGHIAGAVNIDVNDPEFGQKVTKLDKSKTYLVHCAAGVRSAKACEQLAYFDFPKLYNLEPGFKAWEKAGKKVER